MAEIQNQTRARVLIIEDEPIIAMDLEMVVRDLGHEVSAVAATRDAAVVSAMSNRPDLILADVQLADDSSGIDAVKDILAEFQVPVIFLTAYPERLLTGERVEPAYLVTKPFQRSTLKTTISQALFFNQATVPDQASEDVSDDAREPARKREQVPAPPSEVKSIQSAALDGRADSPAAAESALLDGPAPMHVAVIDGQLRRVAGGPANIRIALGTAERARIVQHREILSLLEARVGSNLGAQLERRLQSLEETLARPVDADSGIEIGVKARNLRRVVVSLTEQATPSTLAELEALADSLDELAWLFPSWREFVVEARPLHGAEAGALRDVARQIAAQPDELIAPEVKQAVSELTSDAAAEETEGRAGIAQTALGRVVARILAAVGAWVGETIFGIGENANLSFRKVVGGTLGVAAALVIVVAPAANLLAQRFPDHFEAIVRLSEQVKKAIP